MQTIIDGLDTWVEKFKAIRANPTAAAIESITSDILELSEDRYQKDENGEATDEAKAATELYRALGADYVVRNAEELYADLSQDKDVRVAALALLMNVPDAEERAFMAAVGMLSSYEVDPDFYDALAYGLSHPLWDRRRDDKEYGEQDATLRALKGAWDNYPALRYVLIRPMLRFDPYYNTVPYLLNLAYAEKDEMILSAFAGAMLYRTEWVGGYFVDQLVLIAESDMACSGDALEALAAHFDRLYGKDEGDKGHMARMLSLAVFWGDLHVDTDL